LVDRPGPPADFEELWRLWRPRAAAYLRSFAGLSDEDREEAANEAVLKAWRARGVFDARRDFAPWFLAIARRTALDALRRGRAATRGRAVANVRARHLPEGTDPVAAIPSAAAGAEELAMRDADRDFVRRFLAKAEPETRELASLVYGQGLRLKSAAAVLGMPEGTAKWRLSELRKALMAAWEVEYGEARVS